MKVFPFFQKIDGKTFLIVGGGRIAAEKAERLLPFADRILVVGARICGEIRAMEKAGGNGDGVRVEERPFEEADLDRADYCIAATDDACMNRRIHDLCVERRIPVNVVDTMELCEFIFPSLIKHGDLTIAVSTAGKSPAMARYVKKQTEAVLSPYTEDILDRLGQLRSVLPERIGTQKQRGRAYMEILELLMETDNRASEEEVDQIIERYTEQK